MIYLMEKKNYNAAVWELSCSYLHTPFIKGFLPYIGLQGAAQ